MSVFRSLSVILLAAGMFSCGSSGEAGDTTQDAGRRDGSGGSSAIELPDGSGEAATCLPKTCTALELNCGAVADGCGGILSCGDCAADAVCGLQKPNVCGKPADLCKPISRDQACAGKACGVEGDGCGKTYDCGSCPSGSGCGVEAPFQCAPGATTSPDNCPAKIASCALAGVECGLTGNGCGGTIDCNAERGGCPAGQACGLGGIGKCGTVDTTCQPLTPAAACAGRCGLVSNGCGAEVAGGLIDCSLSAPCPSGQACGAGGVPNQCGSSATACHAIAKAVACGSRVCGKVSDGCEGSYDCGTCGAGELCRAGVCAGLVCQPVPMATACSGKSCGVVSNGCEGTSSRAWPSRWRRYAPLKT
jgi:hypothetical protein